MNKPLTTDIEEARKIRNKGCSEMHQKAVAVWEDEKQATKAAKKVFKKLKPKQETLESPVSRPKVTDLPERSNEEDKEDNSDDEED